MKMDAGRKRVLKKQKNETLGNRKIKEIELLSA